jgi:hypothetical protein
MVWIDHTDHYNTNDNPVFMVRLQRIFSVVERRYTGRKTVQ